MSALRSSNSSVARKNALYTVTLEHGMLDKFNIVFFGNVFSSAPALKNSPSIRTKKQSHKTQRRFKLLKMICTRYSLHEYLSNAYIHTPPQKLRFSSKSENQMHPENKKSLFP